jgi:hypothetical protein
MVGAGGEGMNGVKMLAPHSTWPPPPPSPCCNPLQTASTQHTAHPTASSPPPPTCEVQRHGQQRRHLQEYVGPRLLGVLLEVWTAQKDRGQENAQTGGHQAERNKGSIAINTTMCVVHPVKS